MVTRRCVVTASVVGLVYCKIVWLLSLRAELALRVLRTIGEGKSVSSDDAIKLRNWAVHPGDEI
jgi:hypothetical protein